MAQKKKQKRQLTQRESRNLRMQQVIFIAIGVIVILSMVLALVQ